jgi:CheY-like chemotaxis protein
MASVLIVEDESTDLVILRDIVEASGHEVHLASGGEQALNLYRGISIDVVVTDLQMLHMDGLELMVALQALFPDVAIIVVSGKGPSCSLRLWTRAPSRRSASPSTPTS